MNEWVFGTQLAAFGLFFWFLILVVWRVEVKHRKSRPRRKWNEKEPKDGVPSLLDYATGGFGDLVALPLLDFAVGTMVYREGVGSNVFLVALLVGIVAAYLFYRMATLMKRAAKDIDWWFRFLGVRIGWQSWGLGSAKVRVSLAGYVHLVYYAFQWAVAALGVWFVFIQREGWPVLAALGLFSVIVYLGTFGWDYKKGHFD